ncbi:MAG: hypothetical protein HRT90_02085 [Candidatus Margulisbacteria bacterium]|nr:hypothetical protein [Candidatus Margulisiibacteriota bacterium]
MSIGATRQILATEIVFTHVKARKNSLSKRKTIKEWLIGIFNEENKSEKKSKTQDFKRKLDQTRKSDKKKDYINRTCNLLIYLGTRPAFKFLNKLASTKNADDFILALNSVRNRATLIQLLNQNPGSIKLAQEIYKMLKIFQNNSTSKILPEDLQAIKSLAKTKMSQNQTATADKYFDIFEPFPIESEEERSKLAKFGIAAAKFFATSFRIRSANKICPGIERESADSEEVKTEASPLAPSDSVIYIPDSADGGSGDDEKIDGPLETTEEGLVENPPYTCFDDTDNSVADENKVRKPDKINFLDGQYVGNVDENNIPSGHGTYTKNYVRHTGDWVNGKIVDKCTIRYPNGDTYKGPVNDALEPNGTGFLQVNKKRYRGCWHNGKKQGDFNITFIGDKIYLAAKCNFDRDVVIGNDGKVEYKSSTDLHRASYTGQLNDNLEPHGRGEMTFKAPSDFKSYKDHFVEGEVDITRVGTLTYRDETHLTGKVDTNFRTIQGKRFKDRSAHPHYKNYTTESRVKVPAVGPNGCVNIKREDNESKEDEASTKERTAHPDVWKITYKNYVYVGSVNKDDKFHGRGTLTFEGTTVTGEFINGYLHTGKITFPVSSEFTIGTFSYKNKRQYMKAQYRDKNKFQRATYEGFIDQSFRPHGIGEITYNQPNQSSKTYKVYFQHGYIKETYVASILGFPFNHGNQHSPLTHENQKDIHMINVDRDNFLKTTLTPHGNISQKERFMKAVNDDSGIDRVAMEEAIEKFEKLSRVDQTETSTCLSKRSHSIIVRAQIETKRRRKPPLMRSTLGRNRTDHDKPKNTVAPSMKSASEIELKQKKTQNAHDKAQTLSETKDDFERN